MTKHMVAKMEPLRKILTKYGWQDVDKTTWKHPQNPDYKIVIVKPTSWALLKLDITAKDDYQQVASGISSAELEKALK